MAEGWTTESVLKKHGLWQELAGPAAGPTAIKLQWQDMQIEKFRALLLESKRSHYVCEDCWYSCPKSGECCDERQKECNCGASEWNAKVDAALGITTV